MIDDFRLELVAAPAAYDPSLPRRHLAVPERRVHPYLQAVLLRLGEHAVRLREADLRHDDKYRNFWQCIFGNKDMKSPYVKKAFVAAHEYRSL